MMQPLEQNYVELGNRLRDDDLVSREERRARRSTDLQIVKPPHQGSLHSNTRIDHGELFESLVLELMSRAITTAFTALSIPLVAFGLAPDDTAS